MKTSYRFFKSSVDSKANSKMYPVISQSAHCLTFLFETQEAFEKCLERKKKNNEKADERADVRGSDRPTVS